MSNDNETSNDHTPPALPPFDPIEALLKQQTRELDMIFQKYLKQGQIGYLRDSKLTMALRTQAQCRATASTLRQLQKQNPKDKKK